jgi:hypothetical protein
VRPCGPLVVCVEGQSEYVARDPEILAADNCCGGQLLHPLRHSTDLRGIAAIVDETVEARGHSRADPGEPMPATQSFLWTERAQLNLGRLRLALWIAWQAKEYLRRASHVARRRLALSTRNRAGAVLEGAGHRTHSAQAAMGVATIASGKDDLAGPLIEPPT